MDSANLPLPPAQYGGGVLSIPASATDAKAVFYGVMLRGTATAKLIAKKGRRDLREGQDLEYPARSRFALRFSLQLPERSHGEELDT